MSITPGSWKVIPGIYDTNPETASEFPRGPEIIADDDASIASVHMHGEDDAVLIASAPDLLTACKAQHNAIDILFAMLIERDTSFMPTKSPVWDACLQGHAAIAKAEGTK